MGGTTGPTGLAHTPLPIQSVDESEVEELTLLISEGEVLKSMSQVEGNGQDGGVGRLRDDLWRHIACGTM